MKKGDELINAKITVLKQSDMMKCPHYIMVAGHYRADGSCKCNDPNDPKMKSWGYRWNDKLKQWS